jgi:hypothetical protein
MKIVGKQIMKYQIPHQFPKGNIKMRRSDLVNKYQKYLNMRTKRLFKSEENYENYSYKKCRGHWHHALQTSKHYKTLLKNLKIVKR